MGGSVDVEAFRGFIARLVLVSDLNVRLGTMMIRRRNTSLGSDIPAPAPKRSLN